jgi:hypothetical protein
MFTWLEMDVHQLLDARSLMDVHSRCLTLFVTHYPRIAELQSKYPGEIGPYFVSYLAEDPSAKISELKPSAQDPHVEEATENHISLQACSWSCKQKLWAACCSSCSGLNSTDFTSHQKSTLISYSCNNIYPQH